MTTLAPYATDVTRSRGRQIDEAPSAYRTAFQRDRDRILHSGAFRKLQYKTQVFVNHEGDYYRTRLTHSLEVAQITRSLCRTLQLDEDLGEAVALAHDLGHTCFGHAGEDALNACMADVGGFHHNDQTLRVLVHLEHRYAEFDGLNLSWETLEGIAKHNGPVLGDEVTETVRALDELWSLDLDGYAGLEAQIAALADDIAYTAHDLDDGLRGGYFTLAELEALPLVGAVLAEVHAKYPELNERRIRGEMHRRLIGLLTADVLAETRRRLAESNPQSVEDVRAAGRPFVQFSEGLRSQERVVRQFLMDRLYRHYRVMRTCSKATRIVSDLYQEFITEPRTLPPRWQERIPRNATPHQLARIVADYIAGMTDRFAIEEHKRLFDMDVQG